MGEKIVSKLFSGEYESYVTCNNVQYESVRNEGFQDIQLTIPKNKNYSKKTPDIYDCIRKFIEPEHLNGDNQYYANDTLKKQDAVKGLRFKRFPPVLFLQLCRFEIDHSQHTQKINDPVQFYEDIDLDPFVYDANGSISEINKHYKQMAHSEDGCGAFSYQLFSVLVHSGSTYGGHYFAYINPSGAKWYKFDDENVYNVDSEEATTKQFGGSSRQSAYMLVYIQKKYAMQILREINEDSDIPKELRQYFKKERLKAQQLRLQQIENMKMCNISILTNDSIINNEKAVNIPDMGYKQLLQTTKVYKDTTIKQLFIEWSQTLNIPIQNLMVWNYTERKNKTLRANREIKLDLNQESKHDDNQYTEDQIKRHLIRTE